MAQETGDKMWRFIVLCLWLGSSLGEVSDRTALPLADGWLVCKELVRGR